MSTTTSLQANPNNPRKIDDAKLQMLADSLAEFGDLSGVVVNKRTNQLVSGHQRVRVWNESTAGNVVIDQTFSGPGPRGTVALGRISVDGEFFAYREVDWPEAKEKAANLAANRNAGEFDLPMVADIMSELKQSEFNLDLTMFNADERGGLPDSSDFGELPEPTSKLDEKAKTTCPSCGHEF